ncbi:MAG TPA: hypothetical protein VFM18_17145 [Methanosarcina sp.]|nr:hypothetical protein [Methanosarcina sp.]
MINRADIEGMLTLAETNRGMADLLSTAKEYYILNGSPKGDGRFTPKETEAERKYRILNTRYGL